jgi:hypothetical protein
LLQAYSKYLLKASSDRFVNEYSQLARQPKARSDDIQNVESWLLNNHVGAIDMPERQYIMRHEDLIAVQPKVRSWFRDVLEMTYFLALMNHIPGLRSCFTRKPMDYEAISDGKGYWQHDKRVEGFSTFTISIAGMGMLVGPLWWLNFVSQQEIRLGVITGFIVVFFVLVLVATTAKVSDALAAAAAYSAVLMVFLQLGSGAAGRGASVANPLGTNSSSASNG